MSDIEESSTKKDLPTGDLRLAVLPDYWEQRAKAAEEAVRTLTQCFAVLCDREEKNTVILMDKELIEIEGRPTLITFHNKEKGQMEIQHVRTK